jgi:phosphatidylglycerol---prolipoprotein diacylglyceryl transferase
LYKALNPIAFSLGPIQVHWYGIILGMAALIGLFIVIQEGKRYQINSDFFMDMLMIGLPSAIIGARAYYVIFKWDEYRNNFMDVFKIWNGGIAIYGALIGAIIAMIFYFRSRGYNFWRIADICAPGLIVGQLIGRWGNFMNQEAHGGPISEDFLRQTLHLPDFIVHQMNIDGVFYHPTFLYESVWNLAGFFILLWLRRRPFLRAGELFMSYFIWYSIGRFFVEGLRTDSLAFDGPTWLASLMRGLWTPMKILFQEGTMDYGNTRVSQLVGVFIILFAIGLIMYRRKVKKVDVRYSDPIVSSK